MPVPLLNLKKDQKLNKNAVLSIDRPCPSLQGVLSPGIVNILRPASDGLRAALVSRAQVVITHSPHVIVLPLVGDH